MTNTQPRPENRDTVFEPSDGLRDVLENLTTTFHDERVDVSFPEWDDNNHTGTGSYAKPTGDVYVDTKPVVGGMSDVEQLRRIVDTLSHEVSHIRYSDLTGKKDMMEEYGEYARAAGIVANATEDAYIDHQRCKELRGIAQMHAFAIHTIMASDVRPTVSDLDNKEQRLVEGFLQAAVANTVKGIGDLPRDEQEFLAWARRRVHDAKVTHDADDRADIVRDICDRMFAMFPPKPDLSELEQFIEDMCEEMDMDDVPDASDLDMDPANTPTPETVEADEGDEEGEGGGDTMPDDDADESDADADEDGDAAGDESDGDESDGGDAGTESDGEGDGSDATDGEAGTTAGDNDGDLTDDVDTDAEVEDMQDRADRDNYDPTGEFDSPEEYTDPTHSDERRMDRVRAAVENAETPFAERRARRDDFIENNSSWVNHEDARELMEQNDIVQDIVDVFEEFATADRPIPERTGDSLNIENYIRHRAGDVTEDRFFDQHQRAETGDRSVVVAMDASGSMSGDEVEAMAATAAIATAADIIGDQFAAFCWFTDDANCDPDTRMITDPDEEFRMEHLDAYATHHGTPTALAVDVGDEYLQRMTRTDPVLFVVTDGNPEHILPTGENYSSKAREQARDRVDDMRQRGVTVIGVGAGAGVNPYKMNEVFGDEGWIDADMNDLADELLRAYETQMSIDLHKRR